MAFGTILKRIIGFAVPVAIGVGVFVMAVERSKPPEQTEQIERSRTVRVAEVTKSVFIPRVSGYGTVEPDRTWDAVAQVSGRIVYVHPNLRRGALLGVGTEIIRINPEDYEIALRQAQANIEAAQANLSELEIQAQNTASSLEIERRALELTRNDIERKRQLVERNSVSQLTLEEAERALLSQQARVQDLENAARRFPAQISAQQQQINIYRAQLDTARLNLERTRIALPFDARIAQADVEVTQYVSIGATLATADDISAAEVKAEIPQARFRSFALLTAPPDFSPPQLSDDAVAKVIEEIGWTAEVRLDLGDGLIVWPARVRRTSDTINPQTRTVGAIVQVEKPYEDVRIDTKPPLVKGMFVEVELRGRPIPDQIVVPRSAVRNGAVHLADSENRLRIRPVAVRAEQGNEVLIARGLEAGERLVLTDLSPAIEGMLLEPVAEPATDGAAPQSALLRPAPAGEAPR